MNRFAREQVEALRKLKTAVITEDTNSCRYRKTETRMRVYNAQDEAARLGISDETISRRIQRAHARAAAE